MKKKKPANRLSKAFVEIPPTGNAEYDDLQKQLGQAKAERARMAQEYIRLLRSAFKAATRYKGDPKGRAEFEELLQTVRAALTKANGVYAADAEAELLRKALPRKVLENLNDIRKAARHTLGQHLKKEFLLLNRGYGTHLFRSIHLPCVLVPSSPSGRKRRGGLKVPTEARIETLLEILDEQGIPLNQIKFYTGSVEAHSTPAQTYRLIKLPTGVQIAVSNQRNKPTFIAQAGMLKEPTEWGLHNEEQLKALTGITCIESKGLDLSAWAKMWTAISAVHKDFSTPEVDATQPHQKTAPNQNQEMTKDTIWMELLDALEATGKWMHSNSGSVQGGPNGAVWMTRSNWLYRKYKSGLPELIRQRIYAAYQEQAQARGINWRDVTHPFPSHPNITTQMVRDAYGLKRAQGAGKRHQKSLEEIMGESAPQTSTDNPSTPAP